MDDFGKVEEINNGVQKLPSAKVGGSLPIPPLNQPSYSGQIIVRTMMQKTVFHVYPNGQMYIQKAKCSSWFNDQISIYKKKTKKKSKMPTKSKTQKEESY